MTNRSTRIIFGFLAIFWFMVVLVMGLLLTSKEARLSGLMLQRPVLLHLSFSFFLLFTFLFFRNLNLVRKKSQFSDYIWQVFIVGGFTIIGFFLINVIVYLSSESPLLRSDRFELMIYLSQSFLVTIFLANSFYVWNRMILYQKNKATETLWNAFELFTLFSIATSFFQFDYTNGWFLLLTAPITVLGIMLSFQVKWVSFLTYKQKWTAILLLFLTALISISYLVHLYEKHITSNIINDLVDNAFIMAQFAFVLLNTTVCVLVLLFNLPASSVFERKFGEVMMFQKLHQSIQMGDSEDDVYQVLMDSSIDSVMCDAGWLEILDEKGNIIAFKNSTISTIEVFELKKLLRKNAINITTEPQYISNLSSLQFSSRIHDLPYKSLILIPLISNNQSLGTLVLVKNLEDGFDKEMVDIIITFVSQASLAMRNFRLMNQAIETERYKEEIKIARDAQNSLIPVLAARNLNVQMLAYSKGASDVGGDYYDIYEYDQDQLALVIGDVSGHGTSAAFTMAQMKGVFHSLIPLPLSTEEFLTRANEALARCLEKKLFITLLVMKIDTKKKSIEIGRAGHCLPIHFQKNSGTSRLLNSKGLGLGILRNADYSKHAQKLNTHFENEDVIVLYTDGIIEATNKSGEEYGTDRLQRVVDQYAVGGLKELQHHILADLESFTGKIEPVDDQTLLLIKLLT